MGIGVGVVLGVVVVLLGVLLWFFCLFMDVMFVVLDNAVNAIVDIVDIYTNMVIISSYMLSLFINCMIRNSPSSGTQAFCILLAYLNSMGNPVLATLILNPILPATTPRSAQLGQFYIIHLAPFMNAISSHPIYSSILMIQALLRELFFAHKASYHSTT